MSVYSLKKTSNNPEATEYQYSVQLDPDHDIFKGHFPGQPVLPGVVQLELLATSLELETNKQVFLQQAKSIKFLKIIDPLVTKELNLKVTILESSSDKVKVSAILNSTEGACFKFKGTFKHSV